MKILFQIQHFPDIPDECRVERIGSICGWVFPELPEKGTFKPWKFSTQCVEFFLLSTPGFLLPLQASHFAEFFSESEFTEFQNFQNDAGIFSEKFASIFSFCMMPFCNSVNSVNSDSDKKTFRPPMAGYSNHQSPIPPLTSTQKA